MKERNTGRTTRMLVKILHTMLNDPNREKFIVISPHGWDDCEYLQRKLFDMMSILGIECTKAGFTLEYEHRWNGVPMFKRKIIFLEQSTWERDKYTLTKGIPHMAFVNN